VTATAWKQRGDALVRELRFKDFDEAMGFVQRVADEAVDYGRRPDMCILESNHVRLSVANLHHAGITLAEQRLLDKVDAVVAEEYHHAATEV
jgi:pterin-4a-carbinolamine dehydratase